MTPVAPPARPHPMNLDVLGLIADAVICTDEDGSILVFNHAAERAFGYSAGEVIGRPVEMLLPESDRSEHARHVHGFAIGGATRLMGHRREVRGRRKNGEVFLSEAVISRQTVDGRMILTAVHRDITERKALESLREAGARELEHRMKNLLSIVSSLVAISAASAVGVEEFRESLMGRLKALAATQSILRFGDEHSTSLGEILLAELAQYRSRDGANLVIEGPTVPLGPRAAQLLALAVHELATNAAKYGALSEAGGRVAVTSAFEGEADDGRLVLRWREAGGPPVKPPGRQGFGMRLVKKVVARALQADVVLDYRPDGLNCRIAVPNGALRE